MNQFMPQAVGSLRCTAGTIAGLLLLLAGRGAHAQITSGAVYSRDSSVTSEPFNVGESHLGLGGWESEPQLAADEVHKSDEIRHDSSLEKESSWRFTLAPYFWMSSLNTEVDAGPVSTDSEICFTDLLKNLELGGQLRFEGLHGHWGFYLDGTYIALGGDTTARVGPVRIRGVDIDVEFTQAWLDFGGMYRFGEQGRSFDLMAGGRYAYLGADVDIGSMFEVDSSFDSVAPVFGARWQHAFSECWIFSLSGDMSGFGIGEAADLAWGVTGLLGYRLSERMTLGFGYRFYDIDYDKDELDAQIQFHGPVIGMAFQF